MSSSDQFKHYGGCTDLRVIVQAVEAMGAQVDSCGENKITIQWPSGETVYVRRFRGGSFRWLLSTASDYRALLLPDRDPTIQELLTVLQD